jgi:mRNA interferase RelE/StbE
MYKIQLTELAARMLRGIEATARTQIIAKIDHLKHEPDLLDKPLVGPLKGYRSVQAAGQRYRIIYQVQEQSIIVLVIAIGIRKAGDTKDIYELIKKLVRTGILKHDD